MPLDLTGCRAKIERAKNHISEFDRERVAFLDTNPYVVVTKFNPKTDVTESIMGPLPSMPTNLSTITGDAVQNLRSALDYLAAELVRSAGKDPKLVYFPICESAKKYMTDSKGKTNGMPPEAKKLIDSIEPYGGGYGDDLWILHTLNNADKHRLLMPVTVNIGQEVVFSCGPNPGRAFTTFSTLVQAPGLNEGDVLGSASGNSEGEQKIKFTFDIAFSYPDTVAGENERHELAAVLFVAKVLNRLL